MKERNAQNKIFVFCFSPPSIHRDLRRREEDDDDDEVQKIVQSGLMVAQNLLPEKWEQRREQFFAKNTKYSTVTLFSTFLNFLFSHRVFVCLATKRIFSTLYHWLIIDYWSRLKWKAQGNCKVETLTSQSPRKEWEGKRETVTAESYKTILHRIAVAFCLSVIICFHRTTKTTSNKSPYLRFCDWPKW